VDAVDAADADAADDDDDAKADDETEPVTAGVDFFLIFRPKISSSTFKK